VEFCQRSTGWLFDFDIFKAALLISSPSCLQSPSDCRRKLHEGMCFDQRVVIESWYRYSLKTENRK
jgi:hypothetical protein